MKHLLALLAFACAVLLVGRASAAPPEPFARFVTSVTALELEPTKGIYEGSFTVRNTGPRAAEMRAFVVTSDDDPRTLPGVTLTLDVKGSHLEANAERKVTVRWTPGRGKPEELRGVVAVDAHGAPLVGVAIHATTQRGSLALLQRHIGSTLVVVPLLGALVLLGLHLARSKDERTARAVAGVAIGFDLVLLLTSLPRFDLDFGMRDGNDGLQLLERTTLAHRIGVELAFGYDGPALAFTIVTLVAGLVAVLLGAESPHGTKRTFAGVLVLVSATLAIHAGQDLAILVAGFALAFAAAAFLASIGGGARAAARVGLTGLASVVLLAIAGLVLADHAGPSWLADGTVAPGSFVLATLARASFPAVKDNLLGLPFAAGSFVLLVAGFALPLGLFPFHGWLRAALREASPPVATVLAGTLPVAAVHAATRVLSLVAPDGTAWAGTSLALWATIGALLLVVLASRAKLVTDFVATGFAIASSFALLGVAGQNAQGVSAALAIALGVGLAGPLAAASAALLGERAEIRAIDDLRGLVTHAPLQALVFAAGVLGLFGCPGLAAGVPSLGAVAAGFVVEPIGATIGAFALAAAIAVGVAFARRLFTGDPPEALAERPVLEPFGGRIPELGKHVRLVLGGLAVAVVAAGIYPHALFGPVERAGLDWGSFLSPKAAGQIAKVGDPSRKARLAAIVAGR